MQHPDTGHQQRMTKCHHPYLTQLEVRINIHVILANITTSARHCYIWPKDLNPQKICEPWVAIPLLPLLLWRIPSLYANHPPLSLSLSLSCTHHYLALYTVAERHNGHNFAVHRKTIKCKPDLAIHLTLSKLSLLYWRKTDTPSWKNKSSAPASTMGFRSVCSKVTACLT
jgi:hypothetical protein